MHAYNACTQIKTKTLTDLSKSNLTYSLTHVFTRVKDLTHNVINLL